MHKAPPQRSDYITMVQEPGARVLSQYAFAQRMAPGFVTRADGGPISLRELYETNLTVNFDNTMVRCFSGVDERGFPPGTLDDNVLEGRFEMETLPLVNLGAAVPAESASADLPAEIRHYNRLDCLLYEETLRCFRLP